MTGRSSKRAAALGLAATGLVAFGLVNGSHGKSSWSEGVPTAAVLNAQHAPAPAPQIPSEVSAPEPSQASGDPRRPAAAEPPAGEGAGTNAAHGEGLPFDLGAVMEQVHFAFRASPDQPEIHEGGHSTYSVRVDQGAFEVRAYHDTEGRPGRVRWSRAIP